MRKYKPESTKIATKNLKGAIMSTNKAFLQTSKKRKDNQVENS